MKVSNRQLFVSFTKMGAVLIGGGYALLPLLEDEIVKRRQWAKSEEMIDFYALAQILPGIIAVNTSMLVGYRLRGWSGLVVAAAGLTAVPFAVIVAYAALYTTLRDVPLFANMLFCMQAAVAGMILALGCDMMRKVAKTSFARILGLCVIFWTLFCDPSFVWLLCGGTILGLVLHAVNCKRTP
ncbi:MAG: chromate transporter [Kiritimatiellae bacterium]|nr:chromate transporter [Kiritimatiellia bacterium]